MSTLYFCEKNKVVWEVTPEPKKIVIYKRDDKGNLIEGTKRDKEGNLITTGKYEIELDENDKIVHKSWKKTIHVYKGFPSYGLEKKNMPCNEKDEYYINSSMVGDTK